MPTYGPSYTRSVQIGHVSVLCSFTVTICVHQNNTIISNKLSTNVLQIPQRHMSGPELVCMSPGKRIYVYIYIYVKCI